jgi:hypothetical protein
VPRAIGYRDHAAPGYARVLRIQVLSCAMLGYNGGIPVTGVMVVWMHRPRATWGT